MKYTYILYALLLVAGISACRTDSQVSAGNTEVPANSVQPSSTVLPVVNPEATLPDQLTMKNDATCLGQMNGVTARVIEVIDGDTIVVNLNGREEHVRYLGIDTPEMKARDPKPGQRAREYNRTQVEGRQVLLIADKTDRDDYDRLLRFVLVDNELINYRLVQLGYATTFIRDPNMLCADELKDAMLKAYQERIGIWQSYPKNEPGKGLCPHGCSYPPAGCMIKGNISGNQEKLFHLPAEQVYPEVAIDPDRGELWFCTIEEAITNGWRPPRAE